MTIRKERPPYITSETIDIGRERDRLFKVTHRTKAPLDWIAVRKQKQLVNYALKRAKANYYKRIVLECSGDSRKFWAKVNETHRSPDIKVITNQDT